VICSDVSHIDLDECGAVEASVGAKLLPLPTKQGKLTTAALEPSLHALGVEHHSQPSIVSVTQSTELGTVYTIEELAALCEFAHQRGLFVQMDGARIANAAAALDVSLPQVTRDVGVDMLSFGATKNGLMFGEAVLFFQRALADGFRYIRKQGMQLASKMRFIASQFSAYLADDLWLENARHANEMANYLENAVVDLPGVEIVYPVQANAVFVRLPRHVIEPLQAERFFYVWDEAEAVARWMASWDTTSEDIDELVAALRRLL
jgi:threonine aldolase